MPWFDLSWVPSFFQHETLDIRLVGAVKIVSGRRYPGPENPIATPDAVFYPTAGTDSEKDDADGQHVKGDASVYTATDIPVSDNERDPPVPGARLYHDGRVFEFVHRENWSNAGVFKYVLRLRTRMIDVPLPAPE